jgi:hypothetical protein
MKKMRMIGPVVAVAICFAAAPMAMAACELSGHISASENTEDPSLGAWAYTLDVSWDTMTPYALSHLDLIIDLPGGTCLCSDVANGITFASPGGSTDGVPAPCTVEYDAFLECSGDPSIPGVQGILFKWEPIEGEGCEPGPVGTGSFTFYSDFPPYPVTEDMHLLILKANGDSCEGTITGFFPALPCGPVDAKGSSWSGVKGLYEG